MKKHGFFTREKAPRGDRGDKGGAFGKFEAKPFDPEKQTAVIRSSICTGEKVAGFKDKTDGHFTEVMLIRSPKDEQEFKQRFGVDSVRVEY